MSQELNKVDISSIMSKMLVQLSCAEFCALAQYAAGLVATESDAVSPEKPCRAIGVAPLAIELGCSASFLYALKSKGVLDGAIISQIGKKAVYDVNKARKLANDFQTMQRMSKIENKR